MQTQHHSTTTPTHPLRAASVQFQHVNGDKEQNLQTIARFAEDAAAQGVELIAFPELCVTGYWFLRNLSRAELETLAEPAHDGETCRRLNALAQQYNLIIGAGFIERGGDGALYNAYYITLPDGTAHVFRKLHTFISPHLQSGSDYLVFGTPQGWKIGVLICYDNNIIENARSTALLGADILLAPHQTGGCNSVSPHGMKRIDPKLWRERGTNPAAIEDEFRGPNGRQWLLRWLPSRAHDNGMFILFSNGVGQDDDEIRTGNAMILDPYGRTLTETWKAGDDVVIADLDPALLENCTGRRWIRARRPNLYAPLTTPTGNEQDIRTVRFGKPEQNEGG